MRNKQADSYWRIYNISKKKNLFLSISMCILMKVNLEKRTFNDLLFALYEQKQCGI